jgi:putative acetyltransferase
VTTVRRERQGDEPQIYEVNYQAFGRKEEAEVVNVLRHSCPEGVSLVAEEEGRIVGHILFTPTIIEDEEKSLVGTGLGPVAVLPQHQGRGIGSALVRAGLDEMRMAGQPFVVVVGHPGYYPRFGFERASKYGIRCEYSKVPDEAFMIVVFDETRMHGVKGVAKERPEFAAAM